MKTIFSVTDFSRPTSGPSWRARCGNSVSPLSPRFLSSDFEIVSNKNITNSDFPGWGFQTNAKCSCGDVLRPYPQHPPSKRRVQLRGLLSVDIRVFDTPLFSKWLKTRGVKYSLPLISLGVLPDGR